MILVATVTTVYFSPFLAPLFVLSYTLYMLMLPLLNIIRAASEYEIV